MPELIQQASAIPFRRVGDSVEVCLITSTSGRRWGFPKGIVDGDNTHEQTALIEALEEAGLHGQIVGEAIGCYRYRKWGTNLDVTVYLMEVTKEDEIWQEAELRDREWLSFRETLARIDRDEVRLLVQSAISQLT